MTSLLSTSSTSSGVSVSSFSSAPPNLALKEEGCQVTFSTSSDSRHPASHIIDSDSKTFWMTTGMFPQEFILSFSKPIVITSVRISCKYVKKFVVYKCEAKSPTAFQEIYSQELTDQGNELQSYTTSISNAQARFLKCVIQSGHEDFVAVYGLTVEGKYA
eukprot:TRINITY_DN7479_c0_g1_i1.p1 TRINITY_DN7479_c0_g1~~TRINITY_DN7479_c0_g1_i1.p1  ORF type:complete len:160 (-),score=16.92 TRINITY_DN7479_c0_g1_i1:166-645(-)